LLQLHSTTLVSGIIVRWKLLKPLMLSKMRGLTQENNL
jgi:hypothetical protein